MMRSLLGQIENFRACSFAGHAGLGGGFKEVRVFLYFILPGEFFYQQAC